MFIDLAMLVQLHIGLFEKTIEHLIKYISFISVIKRGDSPNQSMTTTLFTIFSVILNNAKGFFLIMFKWMHYECTMKGVLCFGM